MSRVHGGYFRASSAICLALRLGERACGGNSDCCIMLSQPTGERLLAD